MALSTRAKRALFEAPETAEVFLALLTIEEASLPETIRLVDNPEDVLHGGETYIASRFEIDLPSEDPDRPPTSRIRVDNVDRKIVEAISVAQAPVRLTFEVVTVDEGSPHTVHNVEAGPFLFDVDAVEWDALTIQGELSFGEELKRRCPEDAYDQTNFAGLFP